MWLVRMTKITVLYGTETGNSELLAMDICKLGEQSGMECVNFGMDEVDNSDFSEIENVISTFS